jgi:ubiquinone/menaquinone biosynthesis C-methylase UbiE
MPSYEETYARHAARYEELVRHEDHGGAVGAFLERALAPRPALVVELGCGTGRVTRLLAARAARVTAYDGSAHMIDFARRACALPNVSFGVADNGAIPAPDGAADAVVAGWSVGHVTGFFPNAWRAHARRALDEMVRVGKVGAKVVLFETMGTCTDAAGPPNERLRDLYALLEAEYGFRSEVLDTSYAFASAEDAARVLGFFFGDAMRERVLAGGSPVVPEWTVAFLRG